MAAVDHYLAPLREHPKAVIATISVLLAALLTFLMVIIFKMRKTKDCKTTLLTLSGPDFLHDVTLLTGDTRTTIVPLLNAELGQHSDSTASPDTHQATDTWTLPKLSDDTFGTKDAAAVVKWTNGKLAGLTHASHTDALNTGSRPGTSDGSATITVRTGSTFAFWVASDNSDEVTTDAMERSITAIFSTPNSPGRLVAVQVVRTADPGDALGALKTNLQANLLDLQRSEITYYYLIYGIFQKNPSTQPASGADAMTDTDVIARTVANFIAAGEQNTVATAQAEADNADRLEVEAANAESTGDTEYVDTLETEAAAADADAAKLRASNTRAVFYDVSAKYMDGADFVVPLTASCTK